jgi:hypothetical protein
VAPVLLLTLLEDLSPHLWQDMCHWWSRKCLPLWKTYYHICNRTGATDGAGSTYPCGRLHFLLHQWHISSHKCGDKSSRRVSTSCSISDTYPVTNVVIRLITTFVTGQVPLMEQKVLTILEDLSPHLWLDMCHWWSRKCLPFWKTYRGTCPVTLVTNVVISLPEG